MKYERLLFFEGKAGAAKLDESMGVVKAGSPVARGFQKLLLRNEKFAVAAFEGLIVNFIIACFLETGEHFSHAVSPEPLM